MKKYDISKNDSGQRIDKFLSKAVPRLPQSLLYKYLRIKRIKLNGKRCENSTKLEQGDVLECYISDEFFGESAREPEFLFAPTNIETVYEDENIILINKPAGLLVHEDEHETRDTLVNRLLHYLYDKGEYNPASENSFIPALANRIDRNTCGIVLAAKNAASLRVLNEKIKSREIVKKYLCVVRGEMPEKNGTLEGYILKDSETNTVTVLKKPVPGAKTARTRYRVLDARPDCSLIEAELLTGRTHQIRAQFAAAGHPLIGDTKYSRTRDSFGFSWQALCSCKVTFAFQKDSGVLEYLRGRSFSVKSAWFLERLGFGMPRL